MREGAFPRVLISCAATRLLAGLKQCSALLRYQGRRRKEHYVLNVEHLVYSQNEIDGTVIALLYPPEAANFRRREKCIILGYFKSPRFVDNTQIQKHVGALIRYQRLVGFGQHPKIADRFCIWRLIRTRVVVWDGATEPTHLRRSDWLTAYAKKVIATSTVIAAGLVVLYLVGELLLWLGFTTLAAILLRRPAP